MARASRGGIVYAERDFAGRLSDPPPAIRTLQKNEIVATDSLLHSLRRFEYRDISGLDTAERDGVWRQTAFQTRNATGSFAA